MLTILVVVAAGLLSLFLGTLSEGASLQLGCTDCTPGMIIANRLVPPDQSNAIHVAARRLEIGVPIDAVLWFAIICSILFIVAIRRRSRGARSNL
jgi:hypothetical protein